ncbi:hypothetical protein OGAPHI_006544 [Ogataea philodendri]|uniref:Gag1-like clamp domain-containing protein n=1 Tax=Ogataea philodendri TaxID=1378263 RepID=A0A9P8NZ35_9ASCO|nr:uncharacterized protein OGAPHI_006544 [Ogataea philodendri]KAH3661694.1 hypothetical protein OGAPHI_006544 [Ogataea philodendri]
MTEVLVDDDNKMANMGTEPTRLKRALLKLSYGWSNFVNKLRVLSEVCLESDEITQELFDDTSSSSTGVEEYQPIQPSELKKDQLEHKLALDDRETASSGSPNMATRLTSPSTSALSGDSETKCQEEEDSLTPFAGGEALWNIQHERWLKPKEEYSSLEGELKLQKRMKSQDLKHHVLLKDYYIIYRNLVVDGKSLKRPMNLRDLLRVVEAGWNWTRVHDNSQRSRA